MAKKKAKNNKRKVVAKINNYKAHQNDNMNRQSVFPAPLFMFAALVFVLGGFGALDEKDYTLAFGTICIGIILIAVSVIGFIMERQPVFSSVLLIVVGIIFELGGIGGLLIKDFAYAFGLMCVGIILIIVPGINIKRERKYNRICKQLSIYHNSIIEARYSKTVSSFISNYDKAIEAVSDIASVEPEYLIDGMLAEGRIVELNNDYQSGLRQTVNREKEIVIYDLNYKYKHSLEHKVAAYKDFWQEMELNRDRFSDETKNYVDQAVESVYQASGSAQKVHYSLSGRELTQNAITGTTTEGIEINIEKIDKEIAGLIKDLSQQTTTKPAIEETDTMNGLEFERWCASVLRRNRFVNVRVTPGSNDQGVDVLAEKEGIKYAIQCKCYSTDLSNTPVQEVNAGRKFYDCHVGVVMTNSHFTKGAVELAKKTGILLWDREHVARMAEKE